MAFVRITGGLLQYSPDPKTAVLFPGGIGQDFSRGGGRRYLVIPDYITQVNGVRSRWNPRGIYPLQYLEVLQYIGQLLAKLR